MPIPAILVLILDVIQLQQNAEMSEGNVTMKSVHKYADNFF